MFLNNLVLKQFRNYEDCKFEFKPGLNLIYGPNACGKSNILEAVYLLAKYRSTRTSNIREAVMWGKDGLFLRGCFESGQAAKEVALRLDGESGKLLKLNGKEINKISDFIREIPIVLFVPDDLRLIKGEPELRRKFINSLVVQVEPGYALNLINYAKALVERNRVLKLFKRQGFDKNELSAWTKELVRAGAGLIRSRDNFIQELNRLLLPVKELFGKNELNLKLKYSSICAIIDGRLEERFEQTLSEKLKQELAFCQTLAGPHRDELEIYLDSRPLKAFGSQGQVRKAVLMLKIASVLYLKKHFGEWPITLLDDVLSELDETSQHALEDVLISMSKGGDALGWQCFITTAERFDRWQIKNINLVKFGGRDYEEKKVS